MSEVVKILSLRIDGKKVKVKPIYSMLIKRLSRYGYNDCEVRRVFGELNVMVKNKDGSVIRAGTARKTADCKYVFDRFEL